MLGFKSFFENSQRNFYYILIICLVAVLFTYPFLRFPYDMFDHLAWISREYNATEMPSGRGIWHFLWAKLFYYLSIVNSEMIFRAKIIHVVQTYISFFAVYLFSNVVIRNLFKDIDKTILGYLSLWSVLIWFSIFATYSMRYQLVWNLWYSVNYQVTLPLFWYITALTLVLLLEVTSLKKKIFYIIQILLISRFILQAHSMEYLYYLMYISIFCMVYIDKIFFQIKKHYYIAVPIIITIFAAIVCLVKKYQPEKSKIFDYLEIDKLPSLYENILIQGNMLVNGGNRAHASINELMIVILYIGIMVTLLILRNKIVNKFEFINIRFYVFILATSLFITIPLFVCGSGLFAVITHVNIVNRFYYSSSLFLLIPAFIYYLLYLKAGKKVNIIKINISIAFILFSVLLYSKYYTQNKIYATNVKSIQNSFFQKRNSFHLSQQEIDTIGKYIRKHEKSNITKKKNYYYARPDIAFIIKYIYGKQVLWEDYTTNPMYAYRFMNYSKRYRHEKRKKTENIYNLVLFKTPKGFPEYVPFK